MIEYDENKAIRQFLSYIAASKYTYENIDIQYKTSDSYKYINSLFRAASSLGLPIEEEYEKVKRKWEEIDMIFAEDE